MQIKVFGERNSGNNYLMHLLKANFKGKYFPKGWVKKYGWTHGMPKNTDFDAAFILIIKNPYSWLLSMHNNPHIRGFIKKPFSTFIRNKIDGYNNPIEMWNSKYFTWLGTFSNLNAQFVTYEELIADPKKVIRRISENIDLELRPEFFRDITKVTHPNGTLREDKFTKRDFYLNKEWMPLISKEDYEFINSQVDHYIMKLFDYEHCTNPML